MVHSTTKVTFLDIPSGSSVRLGGWDGRISAESANPFIPEGFSVFEASCEKGIKGKLDRDYDKRKADPRKAVPNETTYIAITPRLYTNKEKWSEERNKEKIWKEVKVYDADSLSQWLDTAPSVAIWLAEQIGKVPSNGTLSLSRYWEEWSKKTTPEITPDLLVASREAGIDKIKNLILGQPSDLSIEANTKDEAIAYIAAVAMETSEQWGEGLLSKALVVEDRDAWLKLTSSSTPLLLIPNFEGEFSVKSAVEKNNHVIVPVEKGEDSVGNSFLLPRTTHQGFSDAMKRMGLSELEIRKLETASGRNIAVLRRRLINQSGRNKPSWATPETAKILIPALLLGKWTESGDDLSVLSRLANRPSSEVLRDYKVLVNVPDAPIRYISGNWRLTSHEEAWEVLGSFLTNEDLEKLVKEAQIILTEMSPSYDMAKDERYLAGVKGKRMVFSRALREGVTETLALMCVRPEATGTSSDIVKNASERTIRKVFEARKDWKLWATLQDELATIAEAAPDIFLEAVEATLSGSPQTFIDLFDQENGGIWSACVHSGLLWALEKLAWDRESFSRTALALAGLSSLDPGGKYSNRPSESLHALFIGWIRYTGATEDERLQTIDLILSKEPKVGWDLLVSVCPETHETVSERYHPVWRNWAQEVKRNPTGIEFHNYIGGIYERVLKHIGAIPERWESILGKYSGFAPDTRLALLDKIEKTDLSLVNTDEWKETWATLRDILNRHSTYPDTDWAMPAEELARWKKVYERISPKDLSIKHGWIFNMWPTLSDVGKWNDAESNAKVEKMRKEAVKEVFEAQGVKGLEDLAMQSAHPGVLGQAIFEHLSKETSQEISFKHLGSKEYNLKILSMGIWEKGYRENGIAWLKEFVLKAKQAGLFEEAVADAYLSVPPNMVLWNELEKEDISVVSSYWSRINSHAFGFGSLENFEYGLRHLLEVGRAQEVIDATAYTDKDVPVEILVQALQEAPKQLSKQTHTLISPHHLAQLFEKLDKSGLPLSDIAKLEVPFADVLRLDRPVLALHKEVLQDPVVFTDLITWAYKPSDERIEDESLAEEERINRAHFAWSVLHNLRIIPGQTLEAVDESVLLDFVNKARTLCKEKGREIIGDQIIGQVLASSPTGKDGIWPCEEVRNVLDIVKSAELGRGFQIGKYNLRGVTTRSMDDGGKQEYNIAEIFKKDAAALQFRWPFTAKILNSLAASYENHGKQEDNEVELRDL
jgi:hypothetical protein